MIFNTFSIQMQKDANFTVPQKRSNVNLESSLELEKVFLKKKKQKKKKKKKNKCPPLSVILVRNISSRPVLHLYQVSSKYSKGYLCYRAETNN